ncbi:MAG: P-II family nitrogen regulator [Cyclobacteriaceae bacterium]|nr:P-II family nitrogen regulator [Cyclobacteriaceae bacterium]MCH8516814.1 P-II family nitrogen regulator [Cyclobacteriaceae bacterium]
MKKIEAIIRTGKFEQVNKALSKTSCKFMTTMEVRGFGKETIKSQSYRGTTFDVGFIPRTKIEIVCKDDELEEILTAIKENSKTGEVGDGKIFVSDLISAYRIRNEDRDNDAL